MEYVPPTMEMGVAALSAVTVMVFEVITVFRATPVRSLKVNGSGVMSGGAASVVTLKVSDIPPMVRVASVVVE